MVSSFRGLAQVNLFADDVAAARDWYAAVLGIDPYFERPDAANPAYVEFRVGDDQDEFGIVSSAFRPADAATTPGGVIARWHVDDIQAVADDLLARGAAVWEPVIEREAQFFTASVVDPFGNVLGLIQSPHYLERNTP
ncbi:MULTISPECIES: VOC family protein [unclassified Microbacterium]|uniref:VOC family protein n=1 Tax=unclassified Microbacterium TaxID=2609290 RepID=UPI0037475B73